MFKLDSNILFKIAPEMQPALADKAAPLLVEICPKYGINSADIFHEFIANVLHESGCFSILSENMNYSVHGLLSTFSRKRISAADAELYGRKPGQKANERKLANILYGGEFGRRELGNVLPDDGWTFRGAGPIQGTGRKNITEFTKFFNALERANYTPEEMAALLRKDIRVGIHFACWFFAIAKNLIQAAIDDNMNQIIKKINGAFIGKDDRYKFYEHAKRFVV